MTKDFTPSARMRRSLLLGTAAIMTCVAPGRAQVAPRVDALQTTRAELHVALGYYEEMVRTAANGAGQRQAATEAERIRKRLEEGDLWPGDRVVMAVEGFPTLSDTFNVSAGRSLVLPEIGAIGVAGVLRSELQEHLTSQIARFINNPAVHAQTLVRLEILGAVGRPGFYAVRSDILISDALMVAGGPSANARLDRIRIQRGKDEIWSGERLRAAMIEGRTLDQLNVHAGDGIYVPERTRTLESARNIGLIVTGLASVVTLLIQIL